MRISAHVHNRQGVHEVTLRTNENEHRLQIPPQSNGFGSSANGGELLLLALATCYCNDIYREAVKRGIEVVDVQVDVEGDFMAEGEAGRNLGYRVRISARASEEQIHALASDTDRVTEIQNTLRSGIPVKMSEVEAVSL